MWGITVAPRMPIATNRAPGGRLGRNPESIPAISGRAWKIWTRKQPPIVATSTRMTASICRIPQRCKYSSAKVSNAVIRQPQSSGRPKRSFSAMIVPRISARSVAAIATSARIQRIRLTRGEYSARQAWARSCPVTTPSRAARVWSSTAIRFDIRRTQISA